MPARIVVYGATGYTGELTARALLRNGVAPLLAGRDATRLDALAARVTSAGPRPRSVVVGPDRPRSLRALIREGDVLISTAGPFATIGRYAIEAAVDSGAVYLDSSGEAPFIREVFDRFGPRAERTGAVLLTALGSDYVPGNLAGALVLRDAGPTATRVRIGYFVRGDVRAATSAGTRASMVEALLAPAYSYRAGRVVTERTAARVAAFEVDGRHRHAFSIGSSEQFALPRLRGQDGSRPLDEVSVYIGWLGAATGVVHHLMPLVAPLGRSTRVRDALHERARHVQLRRSAPVLERPICSDVVAVAADDRGARLAAVHLSWGDPYAFTASLLAAAACRVAAHGVSPPGALGPVEAFGLRWLQKACMTAGLTRQAPLARSGVRPASVDASR